MSVLVPEGGDKKHRMLYVKGAGRQGGRAGGREAKKVRK